jgi:cardiolipin synthase
MLWSSLIYLGLILLELSFIARAILRPHREPASRIAWVVVIGVVPIVGILAYLMFGETNIGRRLIARAKRVNRQLPTLAASSSAALVESAKVPEPYEHLFRAARSISGFPTVGGNTARLFSVSDDTINSLVADIDAAREHVHVLFYIWLTDNNGLKVVEALKRAAARGVVCRAIADDLGSRGMVRSEHWKAMEAAGVKLGIALPFGLIPNPRSGRIDLRNHRKIVVIDGRITYCGSQNCADAEFRVKPKYAPWVDAVLRIEGPVARQNQHLFVSDWMTYVDEDLRPLLLREEASTPGEGFAAQAFGTGPTVRNSAMPEMFESLMFAARREIVITTPYFVPDESMQNALCAAARRGVDTTIVFPAKNDSFIVAAASRSYYADLLEAGVKIYEYVGGLLHTKSFTVDGVVTLIGSANMDRRSFDLNYENNILLYDTKTTGDVRSLQDVYITRSNPVTPETVEAWSVRRRLLNNSIAMLGPLL